MEEIKIWAIDGSEVTEVQRTDQTESEQWLEDNLVSKPELLIPGLTLVGRQTQTEGGPLDLLGVDSDGRLVVFELKRGALYRDAVAQVLDYASSLDSMDVGELAEYIAEMSGQHGIEKIDGFEEWYLQNVGADSLDSLKPIRLYLVGLGADDATERIVSFLAQNSGMDISLLTFYGYEHDGRTLLARQVRVEGASSVDASQTKPRPTREQRLEALVNFTDKHGVGELFLEIRNLFLSTWSEVSERVNVWSIGYWLRNRHETGNQRYYSYARIDAEQSGIAVVFYSWTVQRCIEAFKRATETVPFRTWPRGRESSAFESTDTEIQFLLTPENWATHRETLKGICEAVYETVQREASGEL